jgi:hypothetical protein
MATDERGIETTEPEASFGFQRRALEATYDGVPPPRAELRTALERERAARVLAEQTADHLAAKLASEHHRRMVAEREAEQATQQIALARAQRTGFVGHSHRRHTWRRVWRRIRHALRT